MPIFDQGYQHWTGHLAGHTWRWLAITRHGVRVGLAGRLLRIVLLLSWMPAAALAAALCIWGIMEQNVSFAASIKPFLDFLNPRILADPKAYRMEVWTLSFHYFLTVELWFSMVLIVLVGPNLISRDLRNNALPLYFSRPLRRIDYFLGKLGVVVFFTSLVTIVPSLIAYTLGLLFSLDLSIVHDTYGLLLASVAYGLIIAVSSGLFILALSSLSRNSRYVALFWLGLWFIGGSLSSMLQSVNEHTERRNRQADWYQPDVRRAEAKRIAATDWRPLVSYTANLSRLEYELLGIDESWEKVTRVLPFVQREQLLLHFMGPQFPWRWSAAVLAGLMGLSICMLNRSIKSLDRLK